MKIEQLIEVFEKLIPIYREESKSLNIPRDLRYGICMAAYDILKIDIYDVIEEHYKRCMKAQYIFPSYKYLFPFPSKPKDLLIRAKWMEKEIPYLKNLIKKGYTDI